MTLVGFFENHACPANQVNQVDSSDQNENPLTRPDRTMNFLLDSEYLDVEAKGVAVALYTTYIQLD